MRKTRCWIGLVATLAVGGCSGGGEFQLRIAFPDSEVRALTVVLEIAVVVPADELGCADLIANGLATVGDSAIEDRETVPLSAVESARPLRGVGPGRRLFFAEGRDASDTPLVRGCADVEAGGSGPQTVSIALQRISICRPTNGGVETCDQLDNDCDGVTDDGAPPDLCPTVPRATASACLDGFCQYTCDTGWSNADGEWSNGCECRPTRGGQEWCDGLDNDCDGTVDGAGCLACTVDADCATDPCRTALCSAGTCSSDPAPDGTGCDDGSVCTAADACSGGHCLGNPIDCDDAEPCTLDGCDPAAGCTHEPSTGSCDDGDPCTAGDRCDAEGNCRGEPAVCNTPPADACTDSSTALHYQPSGACDPLDGECHYDSYSENCPNGCVAGGCRASVCDGQPVGTVCDDQNHCTQPDACDADEVCRGPAVSCDDSNSCTTDSCLPDSGCRNVFREGPCDDGDPCTEGDACVAGGCLGSAVDCGDSLACTDDRCLSDGSCAHELQEGWCAIGGMCVGAGQPVGGNPCLVCDPLSPTVATPDVDAPCEDGVFCTAGDLCDALGNCLAGGPTCDDGIGCTDNPCDEQFQGCSSQPNDGLCPTGDLCLPGCAVDETGCVSPPTLTLTCDGGPFPAGGSATCTLDASPVEGQRNCLTCQAYLLPKTFATLDFSLDSDPDLCDLDGWDMAPGPCTHSVTGCPFSGNTIYACCDTFVCPVTLSPFAGQVALEANRSYCGDPEWQLRRSFSFLGWDQGRVCYWAAHVGSGSDEQLQLEAGDDNTVPETPIDCFTGNQLPDQTWVRRCADLPGSLLATTETWIIFRIIAADSGQGLLLDDVEVIAWQDNCSPEDAPCDPLGDVVVSEWVELNPTSFEVRVSDVDSRPHRVLLECTWAGSSTDPVTTSTVFEFE